MKEVWKHEETAEDKSKEVVPEGSLVDRGIEREGTAVGIENEHCWELRYREEIGNAAGHLKAERLNTTTRLRRSAGDARD